MKGIGQIVLLLLAAHAISAGAFIGWLVMSDRLDETRARNVVDVFQETVSERDARLASEEADRVAAEEAEAEAARRAEPPLRPGQWIEHKLAQEEMGNQRLERLKEEAEAIQRALRSERAQFDRELEAFKKERDDFERMRRTIVETEGDEQFKRALDTYASLKAGAARDAMMVLIEANDIEQVVIYLNAMENRTRSKIIAEFHKDSPALAADLLERLRTHGLEARDPTSLADARDQD